MNYNLDDLVTTASNRLTGSASDEPDVLTTLLQGFAQEAQIDLVNRIRSKFNEEAAYTMSSVADQAEYSLPANYRYGGMNIIYLDDAEYRGVGIIDFNAGRYANMFVMDDRGDNFSLYPTPDETGTDNIDLYFQKEVPDLITGIAQTGSTTEITLASTESPVDDKYNGVLIEVTGGTGEGQIAMITDYVGSTKVATATFTTAPDSTSTYATIPPFPLQIRKVMVENMIALYRLREMQEQEAQLAERRYEQKLLIAMAQNRDSQKRPRQIKLYTRNG